MPTFPANPIPAHRGIATATVTTSTDGLSDVIDLGGHCLVSVQMSTAWTAASLTFRGSARSSAGMFDVYYDGTELSYTTTASRRMTFSPEDLAGVRFVQLRSGTAATPVAQAAPRTVYLGVMPLALIK